MLKIKDVEAFEPRRPGAPEGNQFAAKKDEEIAAPVPKGKRAKSKAR